MMIKHNGFTVTGMIAGLKAEINDNTGHTEITLIDQDSSRSFDLGGLDTLISDLQAVQSWAQQVDRANEASREAF